MARKMQMKPKTSNLMALLAAAALTVTAAACSPDSSISSQLTDQPTAQPTAIPLPTPIPNSMLTARNLDRYVQASFDDIYDGKYHGYSVMYEGLPSLVNPVPLTQSNVYALTIIFKDETESRKIFAYCDGTCQYINGFYPALAMLESSQADKLPIRIYGKEDSHSIKIYALSFLTGPNRWENMMITGDPGFRPYTP
jgi:hypothetical protein